MTFIQHPTHGWLVGWLHASWTFGSWPTPTGLIGANNYIGLRGSSGSLETMVLMRVGHKKLERRNGESIIKQYLIRRGADEINRTRHNTYIHTSISNIERRVREEGKVGVGGHSQDFLTTRRTSILQKFRQGPPWHRPTARMCWHIKRMSMWMGRDRRDHLWCLNSKTMGIIWNSICSVDLIGLA